jgi:hypothetical protein
LKHIFLPLPIETVRSAWEDWRASNTHAEEDVRLLETSGGCFLVTSTGRPPRVFVDLLKSFLSQKSGSLVRAG